MKTVPVKILNQFIPMVMLCVLSEYQYSWKEQVHRIYMSIPIDHPQNYRHPFDEDFYKMEFIQEVVKSNMVVT